MSLAALHCLTLSPRLWRLVPHAKLVVASVMRRMLRVVERRLQLERRDPVKDGVRRLMDKMLRRVCVPGLLFVGCLGMYAHQYAE